MKMSQMGFGYHFSPNQSIRGNTGGLWERTMIEFWGDQGDGEVLSHNFLSLLGAISQGFLFLPQTSVIYPQG